MPDETVHLKIHGDVQGVGYRHWMVGEARAHGLRGWVRNRSEGYVEAVVNGPTAAVSGLVESCWQGPPAARVTSVESWPVDAAMTKAGDDFVATATV